MSRLEHHIDLMYNWHRLKRKLRIRDPLNEKEVSMLTQIAYECRPSEAATRAFIAIANLSDYKPFLAVDVNQWFLKTLMNKQGLIYPSIQQIENYKRAYGQFLCTYLADPADAQRYFYEVESNSILHSFAENIIRFEKKFIDPIKELYRS